MYFIYLQFETPESFQVILINVLTGYFCCKANWFQRNFEKSAFRKQLYNCPSTFTAQYPSLCVSQSLNFLTSPPYLHSMEGSWKWSGHKTDKCCHPFSGWKALQFFILMRKTYILFQADPTSNFLTPSPVQWPNQKTITQGKYGYSLKCPVYGLRNPLAQCGSIPLSWQAHTEDHSLGVRATPSDGHLEEGNIIPHHKNWNKQLVWFLRRRKTLQTH